MRRKVFAAGFIAIMLGVSTVLASVEPLRAEEAIENLEETDCEHTCSEIVTKATIGRDGSIKKVCTKCGEVIETITILAPKEVVIAKSSVTYTGKAQNPGVIVKDHTGEKIAADYYTVSYKNNKKVGQATAIVTFKGKYSGTLSANFMIKPDGTKIASVAAKKKGFFIKWKKQTSQTTGYQLQYAANKKFSSAKTVFVNNNRTVAKTVSNLSAKKTYYLRIRTYKTVKNNGKNRKIYSDWSAVKKVATLGSKVKTVAFHMIFSKEQVNKRIHTIRNYYYEKPKQLTVRKQKMFLDSGVCTMNYYVYGRDLMFGYVVDGKTEYRLYFYKNQLIQMLVDEPGKARKTYKQLYKNLEKGDGGVDVGFYMMMENYARKEMEYASSKINKIIVNRCVSITRFSKNTIVYHDRYAYGGDGWIGSIGKKVYKAKISENVSIKDGSNSPDKEINRSVKWLKEQASEPYFGVDAFLSEKDGKVSEIVVPYIP